MGFESNYDNSRTADFIRNRSFTRIALQFPDELLKDSTRVAKALKKELGNGVRLFVMADTAYGSCCVDEVAASHVDADCVVHYGHACMSPTSTLPALFVFRKAEIDVKDCADCLSRCLSTSGRPVLVLFGLEYTHAMQDIKSAVADTSVHFAEVACSIMNPLADITGKGHLQSHAYVDSNGKLFNNGNTQMIPKSDQCTEMESGTRYSLGGLTWNMPVGQKMEDSLLFWIGSDDAAFANVVLTFNNCEVVRYDAKEGKLLYDFSPQKRILKRRYYLVEKAKDANIVGILVGTLGVAGYLHMIHQMKELIEGAGKKSYTLVMGRPNSAKLANFPECDVFVYVSCAQTALLDSKDFLAPVITPFEAVLAFSRGKQWTGEYVMEFRDLINSTTTKAASGTEEARFSFLQGGYMEDFKPQGYLRGDLSQAGNLSLTTHEPASISLMSRRSRVRSELPRAGNGGEEKESSLELVEATEKALDLKAESVDSILFKGTARSGAEFFAARSYQGLNMEYENPSPQSYIIGRAGKASGYEHEKKKQDED